MHAVDDKIETIHVYVVKEEAKKPPVFLPLFTALLCLLAIIGVTIYSPRNPTYEHETLRIPAHFLPLQTFSTTQTIISTGIKTYPATTAHGILTITNGSVISQELPSGLIFTGKDGIEVVTDSAVFVPAGNANGYGTAIVATHVMVAGAIGNINDYTINTVVGSSIYIRNLHPFTGGEDAYSVTIITPQDRQNAINSARVSLTAQVSQRRAILAKPCTESSNGNFRSLHLTWTCQFIAYPNLPGMKILTVRLHGLQFLVDVIFVARSRNIWIR